MLFLVSWASLIEGFFFFLLCYQNIFVVTLFPCFLPTSTPGPRQNLRLFRNVFCAPPPSPLVLDGRTDLSGFQALVCGTFWRHVMGGDSEQDKAGNEHIRVQTGAVRDWRLS